MKKLLSFSVSGLFTLSVAVLLSGCANRVTTTEVRLTSEAGDKYALQQPVTFTEGELTAPDVVIDINDERQVIAGFGASITESSAFVLACLSPEDRAMPSFSVCT